MSASKALNIAGADTSDREIVITRLLDAPREMVWDAMTDPAKVARWWGPRGFTTTIHEMDFRPGGHWKHTMHGPDGVDYPNHSVFIEIVKPERIVYSHGGHREGGPGARFDAIWTFEEKGGQTLLTMRGIFLTAKDRDFVVKEFGALEGGKQTLERLAEQLEREPIIVEQTLDASADTVWQAITDINQMKQWYMPALESFKAEVGFETRFDIHHAGKTFIHLWKVTEVVPGKKMSYSWKYKDYPGDSLVTFELLPQGNKTRLRLTHTGLETFKPAAHPELARKNFFMGWSQLGVELAKFLGNSNAGKQLTLTRVLNAPRELVFKAWTDPRQVAQWWGPSGFTNPRCELDVRTGGAMVIDMRGPDGTVYPMNGAFREVTPPERIVFTSAPLDEAGNQIAELLNTVTFTESDGKTTLTLDVRVLMQKPEAAPKIAGMEQGWSQSLDRLVNFVQKA